MASIETRLHCSTALLATWPDPLAAQWLTAFPQLFDVDDLRLTKKQSRHHFWEWFAAVHIFERDGAYSLVEKYNCLAHPRKIALYESLLDDRQRALLDAACPDVQPPDLLVYAPDMSEFRFAEVKGPTDRLRAEQQASHDAIERTLGVPVELIHVVLDGSV